MSINLEDIDFYEVLLDEGGIYYAEIYQLNKESVNEWLRENLRTYGTFNSYADVTPQKDVITYMTKNGYEHIDSQCHYSAKRINQIDPNYTYVTGFVFRAQYPYPIITHSFNFKDGNVLDFARFEEEFTTITDDETLPHHYYGIEIPHEFVENFTQESIEEKSMKPLLFEWLIANNIR
ncbi:hypothetical protein ACQKCJ_13450 [Flavobacterium sp. NPDC079362]|uniref:hypothetical protein n=1 Tax=Flavobacterium sp. NPDC079362 TaxID=3390566 RepID=UPI003CFDA66D